MQPMDVNALSPSIVKAGTPPFSPDDLRAAFFGAALSGLALGSETRSLLESADERARVVRLGDGTPLIEHAGHTLGGPAFSEQIRGVVAENGSDVTYVVFGLGTGETPRLLRSLTDAPVIVYEPCPEVARAVLSDGPTDLCAFPLVSTVHDLTQNWTTFTHHNRTAVFVLSRGYGDVFPVDVEAVKRALADLIQRVDVNDATYKVRAQSWLSCLLGNLPLLTKHPLFMSLRDQFRDVPAFIVGAGPSLEKNIDQLKVARERGLVIAVNSSGTALAKAEVEPQVLACIESIDVSHLLKDVPFLDRVVRAFSLCTHPATIAASSGPILPIFEGLPEIAPPMRELTGFEGLSVCASVSTIAFSLAQRLGCNPIVLVGQDLAYTGGSVYAKGSPYEDSRMRILQEEGRIEFDWCDTLQKTHASSQNTIHKSEPLNRVPGWGGAEGVVSPIAYSSIRQWFEQAAHVLKMSCPELQLINATEGGAHISGFEEQRLSDVLIGKAERNISPDGILELASKQAILPKSQVQAWLKEQLVLCEAVARAARRLTHKANAAQRAMRSGTPSELNACFAKLDKAERQLQAHSRKLVMLDGWSFGALQSALRDDVASAKGDREQAEASILRELRAAHAIDESARSLAREIKKTLSVLLDQRSH